jgi:hypothetical protein
MDILYDLSDYKNDFFVLFRHDDRGDEDRVRQEGLVARVGRHEDAGAASERCQAARMLH